MSKGVLCEESLKNYLQEVAPASGYTLGFILGQRTSQRDYVVHLPVFQNIQSKTDSEQTVISEVQTFKSIQEINVKSFTLHAKQIAAFLPGGMHILGIFSCGSGDIGILDQTQTSKLQVFMNSFYNKLSIEPNLFGLNIPTSEKVVMHFNSSSSKVACKSVDVNDSKWHLSNSDWKFQTQPIHWQKIDSRFVFDYMMPLKVENGVTSIKSSFDELLQCQAQRIRNSQCFLQGEVYNLDTVLESIHVESGDEEDTVLSAELHMICEVTSPDPNVEYLNCNGEFLLNGHVHSRLFMHPKSTVADMITALQEDIIRSLKTRFELHTDALIEEEEGSPEEKAVQHDLPRRILISLPYSQVKFSNYLFPGETAKDSVASVQQVLGFQIDTNDVEMDLEDEADPEFMSSEDIELSCPQTTQPEPEQSFMTLYIALAVGVLFLALCTTLFFLGDEDDIEATKT